MKMLCEGIDVCACVFIVLIIIKPNLIMIFVKNTNINMYGEVSNYKYY